MKIRGMIVLLVTLAGHIQGILIQIIICSLLKKIFIFNNISLSRKSLLHTSTVSNGLCDKSPDKTLTTQAKQSGNGGFAIGFVGSPTLYRPGQQYTITLEVMLY